MDSGAIIDGNGAIGGHIQHIYIKLKGQTADIFGHGVAAEDDGSVHRTETATVVAIHVKVVVVDVVVIVPGGVEDRVVIGINGKVTKGKGVLCFATGEGYFTGISDGDITHHFSAEYLKNDEAVAFVMGEMPTGIYGSFYEGQTFLADPLMEVTIVPFENICEGEGEMKMPQKDGLTACEDVFIRPYSPVDIRVCSLEEWGDPAAVGAAIMQGGELVGFVKEYDAANCEYKCISAEAMAVDLCRKVYEHRMAETQQQKAANPLAQGR